MSNLGMVWLRTARALSLRAVRLGHCKIWELQGCGAMGVWELLCLEVLER